MAHRAVSAFLAALEEPSCTEFLLAGVGLCQELWLWDSG